MVSFMAEVEVVTRPHQGETSRALIEGRRQGFESGYKYPSKILQDLSPGKIFSRSRRVTVWGRKPSDQVIEPKPCGELSPFQSQAGRTQ